MLSDKIANCYCFAGLTDEQLAIIEKNYLEEAKKRSVQQYITRKGQMLTATSLFSQS